jgi:hypothetical protein
VAQRKAAELRSADPSLEVFRFGFHSVPSLRQLHMHVVSQVVAKGAGGTPVRCMLGLVVVRRLPCCRLLQQPLLMIHPCTCHLASKQDFDSAGLKHKKHWNRWAGCSSVPACGCSG